jgi:hypothetical protein
MSGVDILMADDSNNLRETVKDFIFNNKGQYIYLHSGKEALERFNAFNTVIGEYNDKQNESNHNLIHIPISLQPYHENMVIESLYIIIDELTNQLFKEKPELGYFEEKKEHEYFDNIRNVQVLIDTLHKNLKKAISTKNYIFVIVLNNVEIILGRHLIINRNTMENELFNQWNLFLKEIIKLNDKFLAFKVILISNKEIFPLTDLKKYIVNDDHQYIWSEYIRESADKEKSVNNKLEKK